MPRPPITTSLLSQFYMNGFDGSDPQNSNYFITIRNDLGLMNGVPQETGNQEKNFIHTWITIQDKNNLGSPVTISISFAADTDTWEVEYEDTLAAVGSHRYTEALTFNISAEEYAMLSNRSDVETWWQNWKMDSAARAKFNFQSTGPDDPEGVNCTVITAQLLRVLTKERHNIFEAAIDMKSGEKRHGQFDHMQRL